MEFKKGDFVRVSPKRDLYGTIIEIDPMAVNPYCVEIEEKLWFREDRIELIERKVNDGS